MHDEHLTLTLAPLDWEDDGYPVCLEPITMPGFAELWAMATPEQQAEMLS